MTPSAADIQALILTLKLATISTLVLLLLGTPLAWWLATTRRKIKPAMEALVALPLVLPPTVLGFYLLILLGPEGAVGKLFQSVGGPSLAFSFTGLVIGSVIYSLPFVVQPLKDAFSSIDLSVHEAASTMGASAWDRFFSVTVPLSRHGFLTAMTLGFAHTLGEFGVVLMIGGNIPGRTQVLSIAIYDHVEAMNYAQAHVLAGGLLALSFIMLLVIFTTNRKTPRIQP